MQRLSKAKLLADSIVATFSITDTGLQLVTQTKEEQKKISAKRINSIWKIQDSVFERSIMQSLTISERSFPRGLSISVSTETISILSYLTHHTTGSIRSTLTMRLQSKDMNMGCYPAKGREAHSNIKPRHQHPRYIPFFKSKH